MALKYDLRRESHAIGEFSATMKFAGTANPQTFADIAALLKEAAAELDLPAPMNIQVFNFAIGNGSVPPPPMMPVGSGFQRFASNGEVACSLHCDHESIIFTLREYDRWNDLLPKLVDTFSRIGEAYITEVPAIRIFNVQYINEFRAISPETKSARELFRMGSKWISPFSYESDEAWHCHVGQFIPVDGQSRYLVNINCDISPNASPGEDTTHNYARVLILAARHYDLPGAGPLIVNSTSLRSAIESNFNDVHSLEKKVLGEVISEDYLAVMGDGASEY